MMLGLVLVLYALGAALMHAFLEMPGVQDTKSVVADGLMILLWPVIVFLALIKALLGVIIKRVEK